MFANLMKGALAGGLILFAYQAISWMALPWHASTLNGFPNEAAVRQSISGVTARGIYILPDPKSMEGSQTPPPGPMVFASVSPAGMASMGPAMGMQFVSLVLCALFATWMLVQTRGLPFGTKVCFVATIGVIVGLAGHMPSMLWWSFPPGYTAVEIADAVIGWTLAGLAIAKLVKSA